MTAVSLGVGDIITRTDLEVEYGGHVGHSGGIVASNVARAVLIFSDPEEGRQYGYVYDGFDPDGRVFYYTGAGSTGDQVEGKSNAPILTAAKKGYVLRVFVAVGVVPGTQTKRHRYVGEFILDPNAPFVRWPGKGKDGKLRTVLVFRLLPISVIPDHIRAEVATVEVLDTARAQQVPTELNSTHFFETTGSGPALAVRRESLLTEEFMRSRPHHTFQRWAISLPGERSPLLTDVYDSEDRTLYEAKAASGRNEARMAVGQLYDYRRHVPVEDLRCAVLLPERPRADLRDLIERAGLGLAFREDGEFVVASAPELRETRH